MASQQQVKQYLAYWFQLGKKILPRNGEALLPQPVIEGDRYSAQFERIWQLVLTPEHRDSYLEGTNQTIGQLLTSGWDISDCPRCSMPVPTIDLGIQSSLCPCNDLPSWPNNELPKPRDPVDSQGKLRSICQKLNKLNSSQN